MLREGSNCSCSSRRLPEPIGEEKVNVLPEQAEVPANVSNGGVKYLYVPQSLAETTEWLQHGLDSWTDTALNQLEELHTA